METKKAAPTDRPENTIIENSTTLSTPSQFLRAALWYADKKGWSVFPLIPGTKYPLTRNGFKDASVDPKQIKSWWSGKWSDSNVGIRTGSGLLVLDVDNDTAKGEDGDGVLAELEARLGPLPPTVEGITGSGCGRHLLFKTPPDAIIRCQSEPIKGMKGLQVKADGGYIVAPPSIHPDSKRPYQWEESSRPDQVPLAELPQKWLLFLSGKKEGVRSSTPPSEWRDLITNGVTEGGRNEATARLAGHLLSKKVDPYVTLELLRIWNSRKNTPPLDDEELVRTVDSIAGAELRKIGGRR